MEKNRASISNRSPRSNYGSLPGRSALAPVPEGGADDDFDRQ